MNVTSKIKMDMTKPDLTLSANVVQGDAYSRSLCLALYNGIAPWIIPQGIHASVRYAKPDHTKGYYDTLPDGTKAWSAEENILTIQLAPQMLTVAGSVKTQIELIQGTHTLSTFCLTVHVEPNPAAGVLKSENYINWLQWIEDQAEDQVALTQQAANTACQASQAAALAAENARTSAGQAQAAANAAAAAQDETETLAAKVSATVAGNEAYTKQQCDLRFSPAIFPTATGKAITLTDSLYQPLQGLTLYGKTTQNGTPTPESLVTLVSAGHSGSVTVTVENSDADIASQHITLSTPNGLPGIPVTSGGNYTDENGQQWICDEVDFGRGVYIQRIGKTEFDGSDDEGWAISSTNQSNKYRYVSGNIAGTIKPPVSNNHAVNAMSTAFHATIAATNGTYGCHTGISADANGQIFCYSDQYNTSDVTRWTKYLSENPMTVLYEHATPMETCLSAGELAAYAALHTYYPNSTIFNDAGAGMEVTYVADTKRYIDSKIAILTAPTA